jgi:hypothetical protein
MSLNSVFKVKNSNSSISKNYKFVGIKHTLKFASIFTPSTFKDISLLFRSEASYNSLLVGKPNKKILVKQSYILLIWLNYISKRYGSVKDLNGGSEAPFFSKKAYPSFFIYPFRNYKTTIVKAPMAHKTYSQEQFMIRSYKFSISFYTLLNLNTNETPESELELRLNAINKSIFFIYFLKSNAPIISTNMLFLHKYTIFFKSNDIKYFSLFHQNKI